MKKKCPVLRFFKLVKIENEIELKFSLNLIEILFLKKSDTKLIVVFEKYWKFCFKLK